MIDEIRKDIDKIDEKILDLLAERLKKVSLISKYKKENRIPKFQKEREEEILNRLKKIGKLREEYIEDIFKRIIEESHIECYD